MNDHAQDSDCTLDSTDVCVECGTYHGDPCPICGGRGFHKEGCEDYFCTGLETDPDFD
jgi:hypothetical protein